MKGGCLPALSLRPTGRRRHCFYTPRTLPLFDLTRFNRGIVDTCGAEPKCADDWCAAITKEGSERRARVVPPFEKACNDVGTLKMPSLATDNFPSPEECHATGSRRLLRHLFVTLRVLLVTSLLAYSVPRGNLEITVASAAFTVGQSGRAAVGAPKAGDSGGASVHAGNVVTQADAIQPVEGKLFSQFDKEQRRTALLGLGKHQQIWPTFVHGKSKRGSIVVYRPLPPEAATEVYDLKSDLLIDAVLMERILQTIAPDTSFLLVIDLQHVADYVREFLAPRHLAALHKQSSLMQFVKSFQWQVLRIIFFVRPLCEGVVLINAPAIVLQVQPILEYLLFHQRPNSLRGKVSSDDREPVPPQNRGSYFLKISQDEKALHAAVEASELPREYAVKFTIPARVRIGTYRETGWPAEGNFQTGVGFAEREGHAQSSLYNLGNAPEHRAFSEAVAATLLQLNAEEARLNTLVSGSRTAANPEVQQQFERQQQGYYLRASEYRLNVLKEASAGGSVSMPEKKRPDPLRLLRVPPQQRESCAAFTGHGPQEILMEKPQTRASVNNERSPCDRAVLISDRSTTAVPVDVPRAGLDPDVQEILARADSLRGGSSISLSHLAQVSSPARAPRPSVLQSHGGRDQNRTDNEASTKRKRAASAQRLRERKRAARRTEESRRQSSLTDQANKNRKSIRRGRTDVHSSHDGEKKITSVQRPKPTASCDEASRAQYGRASRTASARLVAAVAAKTREAGKITAPGSWGKSERRAYADKPHQPDRPGQKQATQESSSTRRRATRKLDRARATSGDVEIDTHDAIQRDIPIKPEDSQDAQESNISEEERGSDGNVRSSFRDILSYADDKEFFPSNGGKFGPPAVPDFDKSVVRTRERKQAEYSEYESQESSEESSQPSDAKWMENTTDRSKFSRNSAISARRRTYRLSQRRSSQDGETESSQTDIGGLTTSSLYTRYFLTEKEAAEEEDFDDIS